MLSKVHFISGLPRSGSTLLCALLRQNPRFHAAMTSPLASLCGAMLKRMSGASEFAVFFNDARRHQMLRGLFDSYYQDVPEDGVLFDTNRSWTARASLLKALYPQSRIICCVREIGWIIDSTERMLRKNPLQTSRLFNYTTGNSIYGRVETLMNSETGLIGVAWSSLREAWFSENANRLIVLKYDTLAKQPAQTMRRLYEAIGEPLFQHDFEHVTYDEPDYDALLGMPGMHKVAEKVEFCERASCIPPDLFAKYVDLSFWSRPQSNRSGAVII
jgi:sulfotransferase